jgi:biofilm PGA synthesis N-glycosyltransferase PgaC
MEAAQLPTYAIVTPVRDEAEHLPRTAQAILAQEHRPARWVVVDDGSSDGTRQIAHSYAASHPWMSVVASGRVGPRSRGSAIAEAFERGRQALDVRTDFIVKLDGDVFLPAHYFARVAEAFARSPRTGIVGGVAFVHAGRRWAPDPTRSRNASGAAKAYRTECLEDIGGLDPAMGWDTIDEYAARARGWHVEVLMGLSILHYGRRGSKLPWYRARWEEGRGNAYVGSLWSWMLVRAAYRMLVEYPPVLGGLVLGAGFAWARARRMPQASDPPAIAELRREQQARLRALLKGRLGPPAPERPESGRPSSHQVRDSSSSTTPR